MRVGDHQHAVARHDVVRMPEQRLERGGPPSPLVPVPPFPATVEIVPRGRRRGSSCRTPRSRSPCRGRRRSRRLPRAGRRSPDRRRRCGRAYPCRRRRPCACRRFGRCARGGDVEASLVVVHEPDDRVGKPGHEHRALLGAQVDLDHALRSRSPITSAPLGANASGPGVAIRIGFGLGFGFAPASTHAAPTRPSASRMRANFRTRRRYTGGRPRSRRAHDRSDPARDEVERAHARPQALGQVDRPAQPDGNAVRADAGRNRHRGRRRLGRRGCSRSPQRRACRRASARRRPACRSPSHTCVMLQSRVRSRRAGC